MNKDSNKVKNRTEGSVLAILWRNMLSNSGLDNSLAYLVSRYVAKSKSKSMAKVKSKTKASLLADINSEDMTWKTFINLLFNFIKVTDMEITIKLKHACGDITIDTVKVPNPRNIEIQEENTDDTK